MNTSSSAAPPSTNVTANNTLQISRMSSSAATPPASSSSASGSAERPEGPTSSNSSSSGNAPLIMSTSEERPDGDAHQQQQHEDKGRSHLLLGREHTVSKADGFAIDHHEHHATNSSANRSRSTSASSFTVTNAITIGAGAGGGGSNTSASSSANSPPDVRSQRSSSSQQRENSPRHRAANVADVPAPRPATQMSSPLRQSNTTSQQNALGVAVGGAAGGAPSITTLSSPSKPANSEPQQPPPSPRRHMRSSGGNNTKFGGVVVGRTVTIVGTDSTASSNHSSGGSVTGSSSVRSAAPSEDGIAGTVGRNENGSAPMAVGGPRRPVHANGGPSASSSTSSARDDSVTAEGGRSTSPPVRHPPRISGPDGRESIDSGSSLGSGDIHRNHSTNNAMRGGTTASAHHHSSPAPTNGEHTAPPTPTPSEPRPSPPLRPANGGGVALAPSSSPSQPQRRPMPDTSPRQSIEAEDDDDAGRGPSLTYATSTPSDTIVAPAAPPTSETHITPARRSPSSSLVADSAMPAATATTTVNAANADLFQRFEALQKELQRSREASSVMSSLSSPPHYAALTTTTSSALSGGGTDAKGGVGVGGGGSGHGNTAITAANVNSRSPSAVDGNVSSAATGNRVHDRVVKSLAMQSKTTPAPVGTAADTASVPPPVSGRRAASPDDIGPRLRVAGGGQQSRSPQAAIAGASSASAVLGNKGSRASPTDDDRPRLTMGGAPSVRGSSSQASEIVGAPSATTAGQRQRDTSPVITATAASTTTTIQPVSSRRRPSSVERPPVYPITGALSPNGSAMAIGGGRAPSPKATSSAAQPPILSLFDGSSANAPTATVNRPSPHASASDAAQPIPPVRRWADGTASDSGSASSPILHPPHPTTTTTTTAPAVEAIVAEIPSYPSSPDTSFASPSSPPMNDVMSVTQKGANKGIGEEGQMNANKALGADDDRRHSLGASINSNSGFYNAPRLASVTSNHHMMMRSGGATSQKGGGGSGGVDNGSSPSNNASSSSPLVASRRGSDAQSKRVIGGRRSTSPVIASSNSTYQPQQRAPSPTVKTIPLPALSGDTFENHLARNNNRRLRSPSVGSAAGEVETRQNKAQQAALFAQLLRQLQEEEANRRDAFVERQWTAHTTIVLEERVAMNGVLAREADAESRRAAELQSELVRLMAAKASREREEEEAEQKRRRPEKEEEEKSSRLQQVHLRSSSNNNQNQKERSSSTTSTAMLGSTIHNNEGHTHGNNNNLRRALAAEDITREGGVGGGGTRGSSNRSSSPNVVAPIGAIPSYPSSRHHSVATTFTVHESTSSVPTPAPVPSAASKATPSAADGVRSNNNDTPISSTTLLPLLPPPSSSAAAAARRESNVSSAASTSKAAGQPTTRRSTPLLPPAAEEEALLQPAAPSAHSVDDHPVHKYAPNVGSNPPKRRSQSAGAQSSSSSSSTSALPLALVTAKGGSHSRSASADGATNYQHQYYKSIQQERARRLQERDERRLGIVANPNPGSNNGIAGSSNPSALNTTSPVSGRALDAPIASPNNSFLTAPDDRTNIDNYISYVKRGVPANVLQPKRSHSDAAVGEASSPPLPLPSSSDPPLMVGTARFTVTSTTNNKAPAGQSGANAHHPLVPSGAAVGHDSTLMAISTVNTSTADVPSADASSTSFADEVSGALEEAGNYSSSAATAMLHIGSSQSSRNSAAAYLSGGGGGEVKPQPTTAAPIPHHNMLSPALAEMSADSSITVHNHRSHNPHSGFYQHPRSPSSSPSASHHHNHHHNRREGTPPLLGGTLMPPTSAHDDSPPSPAPAIGGGGADYHHGAVGNQNQQHYVQPRHVSLQKAYAPPMMGAEEGGGGGGIVGSASRPVVLVIGNKEVEAHVEFIHTPSPKAVSPPPSSLRARSEFRHYPNEDVLVTTSAASPPASGSIPRMDRPQKVQWPIYNNFKTIDQRRAEAAEERRQLRRDRRRRARLFGFDDSPSRNNNGNNTRSSVHRRLYDANADYDSVDSLLEEDSEDLLFDGSSEVTTDDANNDENDPSSKMKSSGQRRSGNTASDAATTASALKRRGMLRRIKSGDLERLMAAAAMAGEGTTTRKAIEAEIAALLLLQEHQQGERKRSKLSARKKKRSNRRGSSLVPSSSSRSKSANSHSVFGHYPSSSAALPLVNRSQRLKEEHLEGIRRARTAPPPLTAVEMNRRKRLREEAAANRLFNRGFNPAGAGSTSEEDEDGGGPQRRGKTKTNIANNNDRSSFAAAGNNTTIYDRYLQRRKEKDDAVKHQAMREKLLNRRKSAARARQQQQQKAGVASNAISGGESSSHQQGITPSSPLIPTAAPHNRGSMVTGNTVYPGLTTEKARQDHLRGEHHALTSSPSNAVPLRAKTPPPRVLDSIHEHVERMKTSRTPPVPKRGVDGVWSDSERDREEAEAAVLLNGGSANKKLRRRSGGSGSPSPAIPSAVSRSAGGGVQPPQTNPNSPLLASRTAPDSSLVLGGISGKMTAPTAAEGDATTTASAAANFSPKRRAASGGRPTPPRMSPRLDGIDDGATNYEVSVLFPPADHHHHHPSSLSKKTGASRHHQEGRRRSSILLPPPSSAATDSSANNNSDVDIDQQRPPPASSLKEAEVIAMLKKKLKTAQARALAAEARERRRARQAAEGNAPSTAKAAVGSGQGQLVDSAVLFAHVEPLRTPNVSDLQEADVLCSPERHLSKGGGGGGSSAPPSPSRSSQQLHHHRQPSYCVSSSQMLRPKNSSASAAAAGRSRKFIPAPLPRGYRGKDLMEDFESFASPERRAAYHSRSRSNNRSVSRSPPPSTSRSPSSRARANDDEQRRWKKRNGLAPPPQQQQQGQGQRQGSRSRSPATGRLIAPPFNNNSDGESERNERDYPRIETLSVVSDTDSGGAETENDYVGRRGRNGRSTSSRRSGGGLMAPTRSSLSPTPVKDDGGNYSVSVGDGDGTRPRSSSRTGDGKLLPPPASPLSNKGQLVVPSTAVVPAASTTPHAPDDTSGAAGNGNVSMPIPKESIIIVNLSNAAIDSDTTAAMVRAVNASLQGRRRGSPNSNAPDAEDSPGKVIVVNESIMKHINNASNRRGKRSIEEDGGRSGDTVRRLTNTPHSQRHAEPLNSLISVEMTHSSSSSSSSSGGSSDGFDSGVSSDSTSRLSRGRGREGTASPNRSDGVRRVIKSQQQPANPNDVSNSLFPYAEAQHAQQLKDLMALKALRAEAKERARLKRRQQQRKKEEKADADESLSTSHHHNNTTVYGSGANSGGGVGGGFSDPSFTNAKGRAWRPGTVGEGLRPILTPSKGKAYREYLRGRRGGSSESDSDDDDGSSSFTSLSSESEEEEEGRGRGRSTSSRQRGGAAAWALHQNPNDVTGGPRRRGSGKGAEGSSSSPNARQQRRSASNDMPYDMLSPLTPSRRRGMSSMGTVASSRPASSSAAPSGHWMASTASWKEKRKSSLADRVSNPSHAPTTRYQKVLREHLPLPSAHIATLASKDAQFYEMQRHYKQRAAKELEQFKAKGRAAREARELKERQKREAALPVRLQQQRNQQLRQPPTTAITVAPGRSNRVPYDAAPLLNAATATSPARRAQSASAAAIPISLQQPHRSSGAVRRRTSSPQQQEANRSVSAASAFTASGSSAGGWDDREGGGGGGPMLMGSSASGAPPPPPIPSNRYFDQFLHQIRTASPEKPLPQIEHDTRHVEEFLSAHNISVGGGGGGGGVGGFNNTSSINVSRIVGVGGGAGAVSPRTPTTNRAAHLLAASPNPRAVSPRSRSVSPTTTSRVNTLLPSLTSSRQHQQQYNHAPSSMSRSSPSSPQYGHAAATSGGANAYNNPYLPRGFTLEVAPPAQSPRSPALSPSSPSLPRVMGGSAQRAAPSSVGRVIQQQQRKPMGSSVSESVAAQAKTSQQDALRRYNEALRQSKKAK